MKVPPFNPSPPRWETIQQVIRIAIFAIAGWLFGEDWADNEIVSQGVAGAVALVNMIWWVFWEVGRPSSPPAAEPVPASAPKPEPAPVPEAGETTTTTVTTEKTPEAEPAPKPKKEPKP